ncbi:putative NRPS-like protein biosynthetic cluster [Fusarium chlamydosporum]
MVEFPDLVDLLTKSEDTFPCNEDTAYEEDDVNIIIHSSGTTGLPKPVRLTNGFWSALDNIDFIGVPLGRKSAVIHSIAPGKVFFTMAPFFHLMGLVSLIESLCHATPFAIGPEQPMTSNLLAEIIGKINPATILLPPSIIEDIASSKRGRELFSHFEAVFFAGAPLAIEVGDSLCRETLVQGLIGSTEAGFISNLVLDKGDDWVWFEWNPAYELDMELSMDEMYEMVIHRGASRDFQGIFHTHPDLKEYRTKDLFTPHPSKPGLWRYTGRLDDVIILSNGEKFNPVDMEKVIEGHPLISKALFIGQGRFRAAVLVELVWETGTRSETEEALVEQIWTAVQQANVIAPAYAQVSKRDIIFASPDRPFQITPKGTTNRHSTLATYSDEIETLYSERNAWEKDISSPLTVQDVAHKVAKVVSELGFSDAVSPDDNLFTLGMDSLQTFQLVKSLQSFLISGMANSETIAISAQDIYANPSVNQISQFLLQSQSDKKARPQYITVDSKSRNFNLLNLVAKYSQGFPTSSVMLTGSTGSLGAYILDELIARKIFVKIYCINRSNEARSRQCLGWEKRHPGVVFDVGHRVEFLQANLSLPQLGLPDSKYAELKKRVGCIIHCSWEVDFNHPLEAFEHTHIQGVRRLVDFSLESSHDAHLHLVSSIATMGAWKTIHGPCIPEKLQQDPDVVLSQGYAESKFVAESICALASQRSGVPITVHRVGQIAGPRKGSGLWNKKEWLPSLIATSKTLGQIPTSLGSMPIDWIPVVSTPTPLQLLYVLPSAISER